MPKGKKGKNGGAKNITKQFFQANFQPADCIGTGLDQDALQAASTADASFEESKGAVFAKLDGSDISIQAKATPSPSPAVKKSTQTKVSSSAAQVVSGAEKDPLEGTVSNCDVEAASTAQATAQPQAQALDEALAPSAAAPTTKSQKAVPFPLDSKPYEYAMKDSTMFNGAFAGVSNLRSRNHYSSEQGAAEVATVSDVRRGTMGRIFRELRGLNSGGLVLSKDTSMFLRCDELQPQYMRAVITGVSDTPYAYGCFVFDLYIPSDYPRCPPKCIHITPGSEEVYGTHTPGGMSPNLHRDSGKVCLSLLGTWDGPGWDPERSSIYQLLTAISFQILAAEEPYYMEPGHGGWEGSVPETASQCAIMYKEEVQRGTLVCGILQPLCVLLESLKPAGRAEFRGSPWFSFRDVMMRHYYIHRYDIVQNCIAWFGATSDLYHKHAIRSLALEMVVQLTKVVELFRGKGQATDFLTTQFDAIRAVIPMNSEEAETEGSSSNNNDNNNGTTAAAEAAASVAKSTAPSNAGGGQKDAAYTPVEPLGPMPASGPLGRGIQWESKKFGRLFAEISREYTTRLETRQRRLEAKRRRRLEQQRAARLAEDLRVAQLQAAAEAKAHAAKAKAAKAAAARVMTHLDSFEACDEARALLTKPLTATKSLRQFFSRHAVRVAALERQVATVTHCGPRYDEFVRGVASALQVALAKRPAAGAAAETADTCALASAVVKSEEVLAATVMAWAASRDATLRQQKSERRMQAAAAHVQRIAILKALIAAAERNREQSTPKKVGEEEKREICALEVGDVVWKVPRPFGETGCAFDILATGPSQSRADGVELCRILDIQCISESKRSFQLGPAYPHWVPDSHISLTNLIQLNAAARVVHPVLHVEAYRILDERLGFLLQSTSGNEENATSARSKSRSRSGGSQQGTLIPNPRAESRGGPKGSPEFVLVGVGRGGTHTTTSSAASDAFAALGAAFSSAAREVHAHTAADAAAAAAAAAAAGAASLPPTPLSDEMAAQEARLQWQAQKAERMAAKQKEKLQRRLLKKIRDRKQRHHHHHGGYHAFELSLSHSSQDFDEASTMTVAS